MIGGDGLGQRAVPIAQDDQACVVQRASVVVHVIRLGGEHAARLDDDRVGARLGRLDQLAEAVGLERSIVVDRQHPAVLGLVHAPVARGGRT